MIKLSEFRHTRQLARAYRASQSRQNVAPQRWREEGLEALTKELGVTMERWAERGQIRVYDRAVSLEPSVKPLRAAYADPPYLGLAQAFYGSMHAEAAEYDKPETHQRLIERLNDEYDCWAMSLHEPALHTILSMCPRDVRVAAWVKPFASFKKHVTRAWTWEPVIFRFHRARPRPITERTWRDHVSAPIAMRKGFPGAKPEAFSFWVFEGLNLQPTDHFCDVFPGSGAVTEAWQKWCQREQPVQHGLFAEA